MWLCSIWSFRHFIYSNCCFKNKLQLANNLFCKSCYFHLSPNFYSTIQLYYNEGLRQDSEAATTNNGTNDVQLAIFRYLLFIRPDPAMQLSSCPSLKNFTYQLVLANNSTSCNLSFHHPSYPDATQY